MDCYVYYKTAQEHELQILRQSKIIRESLMTRLQINLQSNLQRRPELDKGVITWMEIYRDVPHTFEAALAEIVDLTEIMSLIQGERHVEYFEDAISCA